MKGVLVRQEIIDMQYSFFSLKYSPSKINCFFILTILESILTTTSYYRLVSTTGVVV